MKLSFNIEIVADQLNLWEYFKQIELFASSIEMALNT